MLVKAQHADVRRRVVATRLGEYPRKLTTNVVGIGEPDELDAYSVCFEHDAPLFPRTYRLRSGC